MNVTSMIRSARSLVVCAATTALSLSSLACSSSSSSTTSDSGSPAANNDGGSTPVTYDSEVKPIFQQSCALSASCHGDPSTAPLQPLLASEDGGTPSSVILAAIVNVKSVEDPSMNLVTPGDPTNSYLMHKVDGDQATLAAQCPMYPGCGASMPYGGAMLPSSTLDTIRAWITDGAQ